MARYATGKYAKAISDRSGLEYRYKDMRKEWNGLLVGKDEFERKHPQLGPFRKVYDPQTLKDAKAKYIGNFVMALERPQTIANYALNIKLNNLPEDFYTNYLENTTLYLGTSQGLFYKDILDSYAQPKLIDAGLETIYEIAKIDNHLFYNFHWAIYQILKLLLHYHQ